MNSNTRSLIQTQMMQAISVLVGESLKKASANRTSTNSGRTASNSRYQPTLEAAAVPFDESR